MTTALLQVRDLCRSFGGLRAVDGVSFDVEANRITTIIGPNGAGKSSLFNLISGALTPDEGRVYLDGRDITGKPPNRLARAGMARSFQITNLFSELTVAENVRLAAQVLEPRRFMMRPVQRSRMAAGEVARILERMQLRDKADELAGHLSHGEQRRLEIAVCLASRPRVLLLDEPTQGMSHVDTQDTAQLVRSLSDEVTVLLIEHDIEMVMTLSDHVVVMHQGRKLAEGTPAQVRSNEAVQAAYLGYH
ncbi:amino acid/amide ABC transporter ATP-binding protein 1, HAAT family [Variovorax sp. HW608]|uniref:ABC transporter ATP-binding protein n=1 Tax=Variovorax sp. HW608 TaxID=1034889 RepID=UPI00081FC275|nr:ABC transporter ATP-binding protein [Variovorax sp. HW608]SCK14773.1 amino acid/amide ABC transporter ATP-binding protein 1, HAAT family [Variovorax sp. HW608]